MLAASTAATFAFSGNDLVQKFNSWKKLHGKEYKAEEEAARLATFISNDALISSHNAGNWSFTLGHNKFSDLTFDEFKNTYMAEGMALFTNKQHSDRVFLKGEHAPKGYKAADAVDWVSKGAVTPVKDQGQCGSCWSFSTTGSIEGSFQINTGKLTSFSEENLVQCDNRAHGGQDQGCNGGLMDNAFEWIEKNGLCTEESYPYTSGTGTTGTCKKTCTPAVTVTGFTDVTKGDEDALADAVGKQPVSIAVDAQGSQWQLYKSGIFNHPTCGKQLDHGVLLVGYGTQTGTDYWKIKNSWGTTWGQEGYMLMKKGSNMCGLANSASYPNAKAMGPVPPPGPSPTPPSPPAPSTSHYEDPSGGCMSDEVAIQIQGVDGDFCSPKCGLIKSCPTDVPSGVTATPQCALKSSAGGQKYCALICSPSLPIVDQKAADAQCGANASCKEAGVGVGLCTYDD
jgi:C1A family cysteine protease